MAPPKAKTLHKACEHCSAPFEVPDKANYRNKRYCKRACSNVATAASRAATIRAAGRYKPPVCPCGKEVPPPPGANYIYANQKKYCSAECRQKYGKKKQADPENHVTFNCLNCGTEVTRYKKYGKGHNKYCSNSCSQKHNRTKRHIVVDDAIVLDSGYEALFWGLCMLLKVPVERYDRDKGVEWREGLWYAPDFWMPTLNFAVELKGVLDDEDPERWDAYREEHGPLIVLTEAKLRKMVGDRGGFLEAMLA